MTEIRNAVIKSTSLTYGDHGVLSAWLTLDYGGTCQGFGGYALATDPEHNKHHDDAKESVFCGLFIWRILDIAGVDAWEELPGKSIRVKSSHKSVEAIGHYLNDDWFNPKDITTDDKEQ